MKGEPVEYIEEMIHKKKPFINVLRLLLQVFRLSILQLFFFDRRICLLKCSVFLCFIIVGIKISES